MSKKRNRPFYRKMPGQIMVAHLGMDAKRWAEAYTEYNSDKPYDEDMLWAWFANAIMTAYDMGRIEGSKNRRKP